MLIALAAALVSALIAAIVSILTTRYTIKHGPNYSAEINGIQETIKSLAATQEELRKQQAEQAQREEERHHSERKRVEAANWKPHVEIIALNEGLEHVNKLSLSASGAFRVTDVSLLSEAGAKVHEIMRNNLAENLVIATNVKIPHQGLIKIANVSESYRQRSTFEGAVRFTVEREDNVRYTGEVKFAAETIFVGNALWFHLSG